MIVHGFDAYKNYLAFKQHFTNPTFDYFKYEGRVNAKESTYQARNDFYFFEALARKLKEEEIKEYMLASFITSEDPTKVWIGDIKRDGKNRWLVWQKQQQSITYTFEQDLGTMVDDMETKGYSFNDLFGKLDSHPPLLKLLIKRNVSLETIIILDMILGFSKSWDAALIDPLWESISFKIKKYKPFLSINTLKYRKLLKQKFI